MWLCTRSCGIKGSDCSQGDLKGEHLNVAKISENGKKQRKNWTSMWTVLTTDELLLYKDKQETGVV